MSNPETTMTNALYYDAYHCARLTRRLVESEESRRVFRYDAGRDELVGVANGNAPTPQELAGGWRVTEEYND